MGKSRDLLLWQLGKKPSTKTDQEAYHDHLMRRAREGKLPIAAEKALKELNERRQKEDTEKPSTE